MRAGKCRDLSADIFFPTDGSRRGSRTADLLNLPRPQGLPGVRARGEYRPRRVGWDIRAGTAPPCTSTPTPEGNTRPRGGHLLTQPWPARTQPSRPPPGLPRSGVDSGEGRKPFAQDATARDHRDAAVARAIVGPDPPKGHISITVVARRSGGPDAWTRAKLTTDRPVDEDPACSLASGVSAG